jgi:hypothetical protein
MLMLSDVERHQFRHGDDVMSAAIWVLAGILAPILLPAPFLMWAAVAAKEEHSRKAAMRVLGLAFNTVVKVLELVLDAVVRLVRGNRR